MTLSAIRRVVPQKSRIALALPLLVLLAAFDSIVSADTLEDRIAALLPRSEDESFLEIPWRTDLLAARREANRDSKPIFLWIMNGSPLGCT